MQLDQNQFRQLYEQFSSDVYSYLRWQLGEEAAEELTAECFFRAWRSKDSFRGEFDHSARLWLMTIARNLRSDFLRNKMKVKQEQLNEQMITTNPNLDSEVSMELARLMKKISSEEQELVWAKYVLGYTSKEISSWLNISDEAVRARLHRAMEKMAKGEVG